MTILVTGGCGYIGAHVSVRLLESGFDVLIVDDFSNARRDVPARIAAIAGRRPIVAEADVNDLRGLRAAMQGRRIEGVVHLAGRKAVAESVTQPLRYYRTNVLGTLNVREAAGACPFVFSSSATVYGRPEKCPLDEASPTNPANPYGASKLMAERVLLDAASADRVSSLSILRYFNPVGAHPSGTLGDDPTGVPQNLMPRIERVAVGIEHALLVHGRDYETRDGTAIRDYVHVQDLADAHVAALRYRGVEPLVVNLGSATGATVLEVVSAFERATGRKVPLKFGPRRAGDVPALWASVDRAREFLGWAAVRTLDDACVDALRWRRHALDRRLDASVAAEV